MTLNCVSNPVGGDLIGNAWWSGVRLKDLLAEAGVQAGADAVKQTSDDGWTCGTPLSALTDDRGAMLAIAINGEPLPIEHGFPVRTLVPGLYGYVSACKWVRRAGGDDVRLVHGVLDLTAAGPSRVRSSSRRGSTSRTTATTSMPAGCGSAGAPGSSTPGSSAWRFSSTAAPGSRPPSAARRSRTRGCSGTRPSTLVRTAAPRLPASRCAATERAASPRRRCGRRP